MLFIVTAIAVLIGILRPSSRAVAKEQLIDLGVRLERRGDGSIFVELPDMIEPETAIPLLLRIPDIKGIYFFSGDSPPSQDVFRTWEWDQKAAKERIKKFRTAFPEARFTIHPGAF